MKYLVLFLSVLVLTACHKSRAGLPKKSSKNYVITANDQDFDQTVLASKDLVVVDFYADWCGPCKQFEPSFRSLARDFAGEVDFVSIDYDQSQMTAVNYNVTGLPSILLFKNGKEVYRTTGMTTEGHLYNKIKQFK